MCLTMPEIARIIHLEPFKLTLLWNTSEIRVSDFAPLFEIWDKEGDAKMAVLQDWETFQQVIISEDRSLCWPNVSVSFSFKAETRTAPLELDAVELYHQSQLLRKLGKLHIGSMFRQARKKAGLTQADVALNSGTTSKYISRIENDQSDIQVGTLQKIVELGIGEKMTISIGEMNWMLSEREQEYGKDMP